jgi:type I restriction enzyme M protein
MRKSLGNKRNQIGDGEEGRPDQIADISRIYGNFTHDETLTLTVNGSCKAALVSKIFDNSDFGYHKITLERPLRLNFQASAERITRLEDVRAFRKIAESDKKNESVRISEIEAGRKRQDAIRKLLASLRASTEERLFKDRNEFLSALKALDRQSGVGFPLPSSRQSWKA